jgi:hypothetical protein
VILFVLFFFLGLTSLDPPPENGIAIGTTEFGSGNVQPTEPINLHQLRQSKQQQVIRIFFQDIEEAVVIKQTKKTQPSKKRRRKRLNQNKKIRNLQSTSDALSS